MLAPTAKQMQILAFIRGFIESNQISPTYNQIRLNFGFTAACAVQKHLHYMEKKGLLSRKPYAHKQIIITAVHNGQGQA